MGIFGKALCACGSAIVAVALTVSAAVAGSPALVVDVDSGDVLYQDMATNPWFPASTTKLMTVYVALSAVREGRITLDTPLMVSSRAAVMPPSKMGFRPGTLVTLDNALKMLMVKSPNDVAITIAEGVSGSVEAFAAEMNLYATRLGLHESHFVNPNGLPDDRHVSSARDMAMIARALYRDFPQEAGLFSIGVLAFGNKLIHNHNGLLGRYPGADGMKTGFTCAAGYNVVASAARDGRHLIVVIMGAPSTRERDERAAALFDRFFTTSGASLGRLDGLSGSGWAGAPNNHDVICGRGRSSAIAEAEAEDAQISGPLGQPGASLAPTRAAFAPVRVFIGPVPGWNGRVAQALDAGAREYDGAPGRAPAAGPAVASGKDTGGPVETGAPGPGAEAPLALLGATQTAPAAAATRRLVRAAPSLSLAVSRKRRVAHAKIAPVTATLSAPTLLANTSTVAPPVPAKPLLKAGAAKAAAKSAAKPTTKTAAKTPAKKAAPVVAKAKPKPKAKLAAKP